MKLKEDEVLVLRTCNVDLTSYKGFRWKSKGLVVAPDWDNDKSISCGKGLHGALWGEGDGSLFNWNKDAMWLVVKVKKKHIADIEQQGKIRFKQGIVIFCGSQKDATDFIAKHVQGKAIIGYTTTAGDYGTAITGYRGTAIAGDGGIVIAGYYGIATAGEYGSAMTGHYGIATAGYYGSATAGYMGTATAGDNGIATTGYKGTAIAGYYSIVQIKYWDSINSRYKLKTGYIGEDGLKPNVTYKLNKNNEFEETNK